MIKFLEKSLRESQEEFMDELQLDSLEESPGAFLVESLKVFLLQSQQKLLKNPFMRSWRQS